MIGSFISCSNELDQFNEDRIFDNDGAPTTFATRSTEWPGEDQAMKYPDLSYIQNAPGFGEKAAEAWQKTMNATDSTSRQEYGFVIYWIINTIIFGKITGGPVVRGVVKEPACWEPNLDIRYDQICAIYHTHTPIPACYPNGASTILMLI